MAASLDGLKDILHRDRDRWLSLLSTKGALLFRGFDVLSVPSYVSFAATIIPVPGSYTLGDSPRSLVADGVYTSTDYPAQYPISLHQELSYSARWPKFISFYCATPPSSGGVTPIADFRMMLQALPKDLVSEFVTKRLSYSRNLHGGYGLGKSWMDTLNTKSKKDAEQLLRSIDARFTWTEQGNLSITETVSAVIDHRTSGEPVWFNQAEQWHSSAIDPDVRSAMLDLMPEKSFPHYVEFGDGTPISSSHLSEIRRAQESLAVRSAWELGDVLWLDNELVAHGRDSFKGARKILVSLG